MITIWKTRKQMNRVCDVRMKNMSKQLDIIAFGLRSLRESQTDLIIDKVKQGLKIRILVPYLDNIFLKYKEQEEKVEEGSIRKSIYDLIIWVENLRDISYRNTFEQNNIQIKFYKILPLDFYFRVDDYLFYGPGFYNKLSQDTLSFGCDSSCLSNTAYIVYTQYFEYLWNNKNIQQNFEEYVFTFGCNQKHEGYAQRIYAESYDDARNKMVENYGIEWAFQYTIAQWCNNKHNFEYQEKFIKKIII